MVYAYKCPICANDCHIVDELSYKAIICNDNHLIWLDKSIFKNHNTTINHILSIIVEYCLLHGDKTNVTLKENSEIPFDFRYYDNYLDGFGLSSRDINVYPLIKDYPTTLEDKFDRILLGLAKRYPNRGKEIYTDDLTYEQLFCETSIIAYELGDKSLHDNSYSENELLEIAYNEKEAIIEYMTALGYIEKVFENSFKIAYKGWLRIEEILQQLNSIDHGFIAMKFGPDTDYIREAFREAIEACKYEPCFIDEKEHNNQIVPEIFYEIERSKFLVVDVTVPNYGAYYEAGYALALKKEVIFCCSEKAFEDKTTRPHFDVAQKSMIVWKDTAQLVEKLKKRIEITVGSNN
jgi:hypothetical protein